MTPANYFKYTILMSLLFFPSLLLAKQPASCDKEDEPGALSLFLKEIIEQKFLEDQALHYKKLFKKNLTSSSIKIRHAEKNKNLLVQSYSNPLNEKEKLIYIETEKNWWGYLYYVLLSTQNNNILKWIKISTYGAIVKCVKWGKNNFFYEDSTHMGTRTKNICSVENDHKLTCKKL